MELLDLPLELLDLPAVVLMELLDLPVELLLVLLACCSLSSNQVLEASEFRFLVRNLLILGRQLGFHI